MQAKEANKSETNNVDPHFSALLYFGSLQAVNADWGIRVIPDDPTETDVFRGLKLRLF